MSLLLFETSFMLKSCGVGGGGGPQDFTLETAQSPNSSFPLDLDLGLGPGLVN